MQSLFVTTMMRAPVMSTLCIALLPSSNSSCFEIEEIMLRGTCESEWLEEEAAVVPVVEIAVQLPRSARKTS